jgi:hypothetical protein
MVERAIASRVTRAARSEPITALTKVDWLRTSPMPASRRCRQSTGSRACLRTEALDHLAEGRGQDLGIVVAGKFDHGFARTECAKRGGKTGRKSGAAGDHGLAARIEHDDEFDQIVFGQKRRTQEDRRGDGRLVFGQMQDDVKRRAAAAREGAGNGAANVRRRVFRKKGKRGYGGVAILARRFGGDNGVGEIFGGSGPFGCARGA